MERLTREPRRQDPYRGQEKFGGVTRCRSCGSFNLSGTWVSEKALRMMKKGRGALPEPDQERTCPACRQLEERYAGGVVKLVGDAWRGQAAQVFETIGRTEEIARLKNDQQRILWSRTRRNETWVYCTLPDLAHHIGRVLERTFQGQTEYHRSTEEPFLFVVWRSDGKAPERTRKESRISRSWRGRGLNLNEQRRLDRRRKRPAGSGS